jgi:hypothetical protein
MKFVAAQPGGWFVFEPQRREGREEGFWVFFLIGKDQSGKRKRFCSVL